MFQLSLPEVLGNFRIQQHISQTRRSPKQSLAAKLGFDHGQGHLGYSYPLPSQWHSILLLFLYLGSWINKGPVLTCRWQLRCGASSFPPPAPPKAQFSFVPPVSPWNQFVEPDGAIKRRIFFRSAPWVVFRGVAWNRWRFPALEETPGGSRAHRPRWPEQIHWDHAVLSQHIPIPAGSNPLALAVLTPGSPGPL